MAVVQSTGKQFKDNVSGSQTFTNAFPSNVTAGNTCFVTLVHYSATSGNRITGVTVGGTAATLDVSAVSADGANIVEIWRASSVTGGTRDIVVTLTGTAGQYVTLGAEEHNDIPASPLMTTGTGGPTTSSAPSATTGASTTQTPAMLYAAFVDYAGTNWTSATQPSGWTESWEEPNGGTREAGSGAYYSDTGATGTKTATFGTGSSMSWLCAIAAYKQNAANLSITSGLGALTLTGYAPSLSLSGSGTAATAFQVTAFQPSAFQIYGNASAGLGINPGLGSLVITGLVPGVSASGGVSISAGLGTLTVTGYAPSNTLTLPSPAAGSLVLTGYAPTVGQTLNVSAGLGALTLTGLAPSLRIPERVTAGLGALTVTGLAPTVLVPERITSGLGALTITGYAPSVGGSISLSPAVGALTLTGHVPAVVVPERVTTGLGSVVITGYAPTVGASQSVAAGLGTLSITGYAPGVNAGGSVTVQTALGALTLTGHAPAVLAPISVAPGVGSLTVLGYAPTAFIPGSTAAIDTAPGALTLIGYAPSAITSEDSTGAIVYVPLRILSGVWGQTGVDSDADRTNLRTWLPGAREKVLMPDGTMAPTWYRFFQYIADVKLGGPTAPTVGEVASSLATATDLASTANAQTQAVTAAVRQNAEALAATVAAVQADGLSGAEYIPPVTRGHDLV